MLRTDAGYNNSIRDNRGVCINEEIATDVS